MSMFDRFFKGKGKKRAPSKPPEAQKRPEPKANPKQVAPQKATGAEPAPTPAPADPAAAAPVPVVDTRAPEERCGITADMDKPAVKAQLAKMFRRYNRLASSLDGEACAEAESMLDLIVQMREKHLN